MNINDKINGNRWKAMSIDDQAMKDQRKPKEHLYKSMNIDENPWKSMEIDEHRWTSMKIDESRWKSMKINEQPMRTDAKIE